MSDWLSREAAERLARETALAMSDAAIDRRAASDGERLAILETEMAYIKKAMDRISDGQARIASDIATMKNIFTTAKGVKLTLMMIGGGIVFGLSQLWHLLEWGAKR